jgi:hypothetical protein
MKKPRINKQNFKKPLISMLLNGVSKKNEKFKGVKITLADLKTPLF